MKLKSLHYLLLMFLFGIIISVSCKKDIKNDSTPVNPGNPFPIPAATPVSGSVSGMIVDENNTPVQGVVAKLGALSATTDAKGIFSFGNATLDKYITTVTVEVPGYFKAYRSFSANATRNYISIKLLPKTIAGNVNSTSGGTVSLLNGTSLSFQANSVVIKSTGAAYSGNVKVYAAYIDPTASDISSVVPGSFMGRDDNNLYALQSTGMIAVDLESDNGEALQLANNLPATIKMPIPASLLSDAPSSIDTWSLDEQGVWKKEGSAPKVGDFYEMQVTHFSFWNCDYPSNSIYLNMHVQDQNGNSLPHLLVQLSIPTGTGFWSTACGYTDSLGNVSGLVPGAQDLTMNVFTDPYSCNNPVYTQTIGPFTTNTSLTVTATVPANILLTITGTATDCNGSPIQTGTAIIYAGPYNYYSTSIVNGNYSISLTNCSVTDTLNVTAVDYSNGAQGSSGLVHIGGTSITIPAISVCGGGSAATFTFGDPQGNCLIGILGGAFFNAGVAIAPNTLIDVMVNVSVPGSYNITTPVVNGFSFTGSGTFLNVGQQYVYLVASGTPIAGGNTSFIMQSGAVSACPFEIFVSSTASIDVTTCSNITVNGNYEVGVPLSFNDNTVTVTLNVIVPGQYYLYATGGPNFYFTDSGTVNTTGPVVFTLHAGAGVPTSPGTFPYMIQLNGAAGGCTFNVTTIPSSTNAVYTFGGSPVACILANLSGSFTAGTPVNSQNGVYIEVDVIAPGAWNAETNIANGFNFSGGGYFTTTGVQQIYLNASGTPTNSGTYTFVPTGNGSIPGCTFTVPVN
ncbi:MAG: carboxypeptidase-like regulatory domain-containing protein [Ferruginibacter sp.]